MLRDEYAVTVLDLTYDSIRVYRMLSPLDVTIDCLGRQEGHTDSVI